MVVEMEGITHYLDFATDLAGLSSEDIKTMARSRMRNLNIDKGPAAGVIYVRENESGFKIDPVVFVKSIDTTYYETACGSGTTALGLALAMQKGSSILEVPILQPSGFPIKVSVDFDGNSFGYTQIQGPVSAINEGSLEVGKNGIFAIEQVKTKSQMYELLNNRGLRDAYEDAFGRPPYNERFNKDEIDLMFNDYQRDGHVFVAVDKGKAMAFSVAQPLKSVPDIGLILADAPGVEADSWYIPDVGIRAEYEGKGIAKALVQRTIDAVPGRSCITLRTSVDNLRSQRFYTGLGFGVIPEIYQEISQARTTEEVEVDRRLFMALHRNESPNHV